MPFRINRIDLRDYRNHGQWGCQIPVDAPPVIALTGPNGAGKTNILEAVSQLVPGRGLRGAAAAQALARHHDTPPPWMIAVDAVGAEGIFQAGTSFDAQNGRTIRLNGRNVTARILGQHWQMIWLTPQHDRLFAEGGSERRRFLDRLVFSRVADHGTYCARYDKALRERNRVLRDHPRETAWLSGLEATLAETGIAMTSARLELIDALNALPPAQDMFPAVALSLNGSVEQQLRMTGSGGAQKWMQQNLAENRHKDQQAGATLTGPHRSDWRVQHLGRGIDAAEGSTGEQKAVLIAVILAHGQLMRHETGHAPILLLDEITAHLDGKRQGGLFAMLADHGSQIWITGTDRDCPDFPDIVMPIPVEQK